MTELFQPKCVWDRKCILGEGPVWSQHDHALWFVDIKSRHVHRFDPTISSHRTYEAPSPCGFLAPKHHGGFIVGCKTGLYDFDPVSGRFSFRTTVEPGLPTNRLNDGYVDHHGRLWFGSMDDDEVNATGKLYRYDARGLHAMDDGYVITNGPCVSPDGKTLYHNDTLKKHIYAFDLSADGHISNKRLFVQLDAGGTPAGSAHGEGYMDGPIVDSAGHVWVGLFFGWAVNCYAPDGRLVRQVKFPVSNITKVAFGGADLKTVYATTAAKGLSADDIAAQPLAGGLFSFQSDIAGQPQNTFKDGI